MIKTENARPNAWVYVDLRGIDVGTWIKKAKVAVAENVDVPAGYTIFWSGQYEYMERARKRLLVIVPITLFLKAGCCVSIATMPTGHRTG